MFKKILYVIVAIVIGFVVFYISWKDSYTRAVINRGNKALEEENYEFFLKFYDYYEKQEIGTYTYTENNNTTTIKAYNVFLESVKDEDGKTSSKSGILILIKDLNLEVIKMDTSQPSDDIKDEDPATRMVLTTDSGLSSTEVISTYGYDNAPVVLYTLDITDLVTKTTTETEIKPNYIAHIKIADSENTVMFDNELHIDLVEHNDKEYWENLYESELAGVGFTAKEYRNNFSFAFPEMKRTIIITVVAILILIALGVFIFWPKKSFVPKENDDREKYTFEGTEAKEQYALEKVARGKKEKEDRENRYKNVRTDKSLDEITDEALEKSIDQENTFEKAIEEDKALEEKEDLETNEDIKDEEK